MGGRTPKSVLLQKIISAVLLELLKKKKSPNMEEK